MEEALWYIGSVLVLAVVSLLAEFERIDYEVERDFGFYRDEGLALFKIAESKLQLLDEYYFWKSIYNLYYNAWVRVEPNENELQMRIESIDYGKIVISMGDAILDEKEGQK